MKNIKKTNLILFLLLYLLLPNLCHASVPSLFSNTIIINDAPVTPEDAPIGNISTKTEESTDWTHKVLAKGSTLAGESVVMEAGNDVTSRGSNIVGSTGVSLYAKNNVEITTAQDIIQEEHTRSKSESGFMGAGWGFTWGGTSQKSIAKDQGTTHVGSAVGSAGGKVSIIAGKDARITGSDVLSGLGTTITAQNVTIDAAYNRQVQTETSESSGSGLTLTFTTPIAEILKVAYDGAKDNLESSNNAKDSRLSALYKLKAASEIAKGAQGLSNLAKNPSSAASVGITLKYGQSESKSETKSKAATAKGSNVLSDGDVIINATGSQAPDGSPLAGTGRSGKIPRPV